MSTSLVGGDEGYVEDSEKVNLCGTWGLGKEMVGGPSIGQRARGQQKGDTWHAGPIHPSSHLLED